VIVNAALLPPKNEFLKGAGVFGLRNQLES